MIQPFFTEDRSVLCASLNSHPVARSCDHMELIIIYKHRYHLFDYIIFIKDKQEILRLIESTNNVKFIYIFHPMPSLIKW